MSDVARKIEKARDAIDVEWSDERARKVERGMNRRRQNRARRNGVVLATLVVCLMIGGWRLVDRSASVATAPMVSAPISSAPVPTNVLQLAGGTATPLDGESVLRMKGAAVDVVRGGARFEGHGTIAMSGDVDTNHVEGTGEFTVERVGDRAHVAVVRGHVIASWLIGSRELADGESITIPPDATPNEIHSPAAVTSATPWRALAQSGDYDAAWTALSRSGPAAVHEDAADLMLAADVARLSGHPEQAVSPLQKLLATHATDPRAPLGAFTLGRIELDQLGRPRDAAAAFENARTLAPNGPLAEDALAREVEAWSRAGDAAKARELADRYVKSFPEGRRVRAVKKFGGIE